MAKTEKRKGLKYEDKSAGQPEMISIFNAIKQLMSRYVKGNYVLKTDKPGIYEIYYDQQVEVAGRKYPELCFSSLLIQKGYTNYLIETNIQDELKCSAPLPRETDFPLSQ